MEHVTLCIKQMLQKRHLLLVAISGSQGTRPVVSKLSSNSLLPCLVGLSEPCRAQKEPLSSS